MAQQQHHDMVQHRGLKRIFWPSDAPRHAVPAVLVGFKNSDSDVVVVAVLQEVEVRQGEPGGLGSHRVRGG